jgi:hypothetical protein
MRFLSRRPALHRAVPFSIALAASLLAAPALPVAAQETSAAVASASSAVIVTAVDGNSVTLSCWLRRRSQQGSHLRDNEWRFGARAAACRARQQGGKHPRRFSMRSMITW